MRRRLPSRGRNPAHHPRALEAGRRRGPGRDTFRPFLERLETRLAPANVDVLTYHNDPLLTGQNLGEEVLTPADVSANTFGKLATRPVDGYTYARPLYKAGLLIGGQPH